MLYDLTTFTETDPNNRLSETASTATFTGMLQNETCLLSNDLGAGAINGNYGFYFDVNVASGLGRFQFSLTNLNTDHKSLMTAGGDAQYFVFLWDAGGAVWRIYAGEVNSGTNYGSSGYVASATTTYYIDFHRDESIGTYGTLYVDIYGSSANRLSKTSVLSSQTVTLHNSIDFRYLIPVNSFNNGATSAISGTVANVINFVLPASFTVAGTSTVSMAPQNPKRASMTVAGTSTVSMAPTGGMRIITASMTIAALSTVSMAPTAKRTASMTVAALSTVSMAPVSLLPLHPYTALG